MSDCDVDQAINVDIGDYKICTNCGKQWNEHYHEDEDYCFSHTNGDIFTTDVDEEERESVMMISRIRDLEDALDTAIEALTEYTHEKDFLVEELKEIKKGGKE